jgi:hypothetical protein
MTKKTFMPPSSRPIYARQRRERRLVAALGIGFGLGDEACRIIAAALGSAGAAGCGAGIVLRHPDADRLGAALEIGSDRGCDDAEDIFLRRTHAEEGLAGEHEGTQIEAAAFGLGDPFGIDLDQLFDGREEIGLRQFRHRHAACRLIEAAGVFLRTEQHSAAIRRAIGFHAFEDLLGIVQHARRRVDLERCPCGHFRRVPALALAPAYDSHVVGEKRAETETLERLQAILLGQAVGTRLHVERKAGCFSLHRGDLSADL